MVSVVNDLQTKDLGWAGTEPCARVLGGVCGLIREPSVMYGTFGCMETTHIMADHRFSDYKALQGDLPLTLFDCKVTMHWDKYILYGFFSGVIWQT